MNAEKLTDRVFLRLITAGILTVVLYIVMLTGATWAWFVVSSPARVDTSSFELSISVSDTAGEILPCEGGKYLFSGGESYTVTAGGLGDVPAAYGVFEFGGGEYLSAPVPTSPHVSDGGLIHTAISFTLIFENDTEVTVNGRAGALGRTEYRFEGGGEYRVSADG